MVLDTNIVLDLLVFQDALTQPLRQALAERQLQWVATQPMRDELQRVLAYPQITRRLGCGERSADHVLAQLDALAQPHPVSAKARYSCRDPDDQKFIDLAAAQQAVLLSKDKAVLCMKKRLLTLGVQVQPHWPAPPQVRTL